MILIQPRERGFLGRAPHAQRVLINVGSSTFLSGPSKNYDFFESEAVDPSRAVKWTHNDRKTNDTTRGREIATCAAMRVEIQTCIHGGGSTSGFQALSGEWRAIFFFYEIAGRSPGGASGQLGRCTHTESKVENARPRSVITRSPNMTVHE